MILHKKRERSRLQEPLSGVFIGTSTSAQMQMTQALLSSSYKVLEHVMVQ